MTNNVDDLASYLKYQSLLYSNDYSDQSSPSSISSYVASSIDGGAAVEVDGQSAWTVSPLDLISSGAVPTFNYNVTDNTSSSSNLALENIGGNYIPFNLSQDPNYVSLSDISAFYQANSYTSQNSSLWNDVSGFPNNNSVTLPAQGFNITAPFWQTVGNNGSQILLYWNDIQKLLGNPTPSAPPSTFEGFVQALQGLKMFTGSTLPTPTGPGGLFTLSDFTPSQIQPGLLLTPQATPPPTAVEASQGILQSFISNYTKDYPSGGSSITPTEFAANFENYINTTLPTLITNGSIQINLSLSGNTTLPLKQIATSSLTSPDSITINGSDFAQLFSTDLLTQYNSALQVATDWQGVTPPDLNNNQNFLNAFNFFVQNVTQNPTLMTEGNNFFTMWSEFVGPSSFLQSASNSTVPNELTTYQQMYNVFYPDQPQLFASRLSSFIQDALNSPSGVFNPSLLIDQWFSKLQSGFANLTTSLDAANFSNVQVIGETYNALINVINDLQNLTLAQANHLNFYSTYSEAYTNQISKIPFLLPNDGTPIDQSSDPTIVVPSVPVTLPGASVSVTSTGIPPSQTVQSSTYRQQADTAVNQWIQNLQNFRSEVTSGAQSQQTLVESTNSAVNQETNFATNILQLLNQILQSIFNFQSASSGSSAP